MKIIVLRFFSKLQNVPVKIIISFSLLIPMNHLREITKSLINLV